MSLEKMIADLDQLITKLQQIRNTLAEGEEPPIPPEAAANVMKKICLVCGKRYKAADAIRRGCHEKCYRRLMRELDKSEFTENDYVRAGKLAPKSFSGRPTILSVDLGEARVEVKKARNSLAFDR